MRGQRVGNYVISELLGRGGMGAVYLAEHELLQRPAAIKMLLPMFSAEPELVDRFFDEARAATAINDPGIVQIYDFGYHEDGRAYLVMEYLQGMSLDVRLDWSGALAPRRALRIARQIADALECAHSRGVIHRDLKAENVFLVHDPAVPGGERAKILDFGIAKLERRGMAPRARTRTGVLLGTPKYMSPEQCRDAHDVDARTDVYALGCLLFAMVTGQPPFDGPSAADVISSHLKEAPPRPSDVNPDLEQEWADGIDAIVARCLAKDRADRYQRMADVAAAIAELLHEPGDEPAPLAPIFREPTPDVVATRSLEAARPTLPARPASAPIVAPTPPSIAAPTPPLFAPSPTHASTLPPPPPSLAARWRVPAVFSLIAILLGIAAIRTRLLNGPPAAGAEPAPFIPTPAPITPSLAIMPVTTPSPVAAPPTPAIDIELPPPPSTRPTPRRKSQPRPRPAAPAVDLAVLEPALPAEPAPPPPPPLDDRPETVDRGD